MGLSGSVPCRLIQVNVTGWKDRSMRVRWYRGRQRPETADAAGRAIPLGQPRAASSAPEYRHLDRADPGRPTLFVGNHSVFGVLDVLLFSDGLYRERGISLRMLADRNHFKFPLWRDFVVQTGAVLRVPGRTVRR